MCVEADERKREEISGGNGVVCVSLFLLVVVWKRCFEESWERSPYRGTSWKSIVIGCVIVDPGVLTRLFVRFGF